MTDGLGFDASSCAAIPKLSMSAMKKNAICFILFYFLNVSTIVA